MFPHSRKLLILGRAWCAELFAPVPRWAPRRGLGFQTLMEAQHLARYRAFVRVGRCRSGGTP